MVRTGEIGPAVAAMLGLGALAVGQTNEPDGFREEALPVLERHCFDCHGAFEPEGGLDLERFSKDAAAAAATETWRRVRDVLLADSMPPAKVRRRPTEAELGRLLRWIEEILPPAPPARVTLRRLNRDEYRNAVLDLVGVDFPARTFFPADGVGGAGHGFDVIGEALSMPPILFEKFVAAAGRVAREALPDRAADGLPGRRIEARELLTGPNNHYLEELDRVVLYSVGHVLAPLSIDRTGLHRLRMSVAGQQAGPELTHMEVRLDGKLLGLVEVAATAQAPEVVELETRLSAGEHRLALHFVNDFYEPEHPDPAQRDRNLEVEWIEWSGPLDVDSRTPFELRFLAEPEEAEARAVIERMAHLFWRGRLDEPALDALLALTAEDADLAQRVRAALRGCLISPRFLFRLEPEPEPGLRSRALTGPELATRLAAFLWSSVPDEALLELGTSGRLSIPGVLHGTVDRMLRDARASRLAQGFAVQWLQLRRLEEAHPDPTRFPEFDRGLRELMRRESELFFEAVLREDRPAVELLSTDFTFANERLARHYDLPGVTGNAMRRVPVPDHLSGRRGGILSQGAVLTATSTPTRTSPVLRGKWVLEALLHAPPPPPPADVSILDESGEAATSLSLRERLELHRADPGCATCHESMDAYGFALENYSATGAWRESDGAFPVEARVVLPDGERFAGPEGLREHLLADRAFLRGLTRQLATFALGRALDEAGRMEIDDMVRSLPEDASLRELIHGIVDQRGFRTRTAEEVTR